MRFLMILGTILVALIALSPQMATAHPSGGHGSSGHGYGGYGYGGYGHGYGHGYGWGYGGYYGGVTPYVVERPIIEEQPAFSGLPIRITNPATNNVTLNYVLNDVTYSIPPGSSQDFLLDRSWVVSFNRGGNFGSARYGLEAGLYTFANTDHGWELFHGALPQPNVVQTPTDNLPMNPTPAAPPPALR